MIWSSLFLATSLVFGVRALFDSHLIKDDENYYVGNTYDVTWTSSSLPSTLVDINLYYGDSLNSSWTILKNTPNTGNATVGGDLSNSVGQLLIVNGTTGQFRAEVPPLNKTNANETRTVNITSPITIFQTVMFTTQGQAVSTVDHVDLTDIYVYVLKDAYLALKDQKFIAQFVSLNSDGMTWSTSESLVQGPTMAPTSIPTSVPTVAPTPVNNTNGNGTNLTRIMAPNQVDQTTAVPTALYTTQNAGKQQHNRRLLGKLSLHDVTLGLDSENDELSSDEFNGELGACNDRTEEQYCVFPLTVGIPETKTPGGPYFLNIGFIDASSNDTSLQYYAINDNANALEAYTQFVRYDEDELSIDFTFNENPLTRSDLYFVKYENIKMNVSLGSALSNLDVYVVLEMPGARFQSPSYYYLECGAHPADYFTAFGWKTLNEAEDNSTLPRGRYQFQLYWAARDFSDVLNDAELYQLDSATLPNVTVYNEFNGTSYSAVTIRDDKVKYNKGKNDIEFVTSFNEGTTLDGYIKQCAANSSFTNSSAENPSNARCKIFTESMFSFNYSEGEKVSINFPDNLLYTKSSDNESVTYLYVSAPQCDNETSITTRITLEISKKSHSSSTLSAGAIVGIVCAGVLVLGLAAWWLCMKKGGGDGYTELNE